MKDLKNKLKKQYGISLKSESVGEKTLELQLRVSKIEFEREFRFDPNRQWSADFKIKGYRILVEVEGGTRSNGRHSRHEGFQEDCKKYNSANRLGYHVLRGTTEMVKKGDLLNDIQKMIQSIDNKYTW